MRNALRNVLGVLVGIVLGGAVNMAIVTAGPVLIPPPPGVDMTTAKGLSAALPLLEPKHFVAPFLAHALGTLAGALVAYLIAASHLSRIAYGIGVVFLAGGIAACFLIPAPAWFMALDLVAAYIPMAWVAVQIGARLKPGNSLVPGVSARHQQ